MRTVLAAAAAGALVIGSASGAAIAKPAKKQAAVPRIQSVSIWGHSPVNVHTIDSAREIKVRATVRYAKDEAPQSAATSPTASVTLAAYAKKVQLPAVVPIAGPMAAETLLFHSSSQKDLRLRTVGYKLDPAEIAALQDAVRAAQDAKTKVYLCISDVDVAGVTAMSTKVTKRVAPTKGKAVRDCVKVIDVDPELTKTTKDDNGPTNQS
jgi:hypothetical protein